MKIDLSKRNKNRRSRSKQKIKSKSPKKSEQNRNVEWLNTSKNSVEVTDDEGNNESVSTS